MLSNTTVVIQMPIGVVNHNPRFCERCAVSCQSDACEHWCKSENWVSHPPALPIEGRRRDYCCNDCEANEGFQCTALEDVVASSARHCRSESRISNCQESREDSGDKYSKWDVCVRPEANVSR